MILRDDGGVTAAAMWYCAARAREGEAVFANSFLHLNWPYLLISKSKSIDFDSGGWASCCVIAGPHAVYCEQDSRCAPVIATYPSDYCQ